MIRIFLHWEGRIIAGKHQRACQLILEGRLLTETAELEI